MEFHFWKLMDRANTNIERAAACTVDDEYFVYEGAAEEGVVRSEIKNVEEEDHVSIVTKVGKERCIPEEHQELFPSSSSESGSDEWFELGGSKGDTGFYGL